ncbi:MAG: HDOD domain-containing protein [Pseudomonadota bacterium]
MNYWTAFTPMLDKTTDIDALPPIVEEALSRLNSIATLPEVAQEVMRVADDPESTADDLKRLISSDAVLTARVLKVVNSSFYGLPGEVDSIHQAVVILGMNAVRSIAVASSFGKIFRNTQVNDTFDARDIWQNATVVACAGKLISSRARLDDELCFLLGMLHDIGLVLEVQFARDEFIRVIERHKEQPDTPFVQIERELIGASHQEFGQALCRKWQFPEMIQRVVGAHHEPERLDGEARRYAMVLAISDVLASEIGAGFLIPAPEGGVPRAYTEDLGLSADDIGEILKELPEALELASVIGG